MGGDCRITFGSSLFEGDNLTILLEDEARCLLIFDDGTLPEDAVISYHDHGGGRRRLGVPERCACTGRPFAYAAISDPDDRADDDCV